MRYLIPSTNERIFTVVDGPSVNGGQKVLLTVEYEGGGVVEIGFDKEGADLLLGRINKLTRHKVPEHDHLATPF